MMYVVNTREYEWIKEAFGEAAAASCVIIEDIVPHKNYIEVDGILVKDFEPISTKTKSIRSQVYIKKPFNNPIQGRNY